VRLLREHHRSWCGATEGSLLPPQPRCPCSAQLRGREPATDQPRGRRTAAAHGHAYTL